MLEFHIPRTFSSDMPAIAFTADYYHGPYRLHADPGLDLRSLLNSSDADPFFAQFPSMRRFLVSKSCPSSTEGFLERKIPMLHVHVSTFDDMTFVGITAPHILFDASGVGMLLRAWTRLLGRDDIEEIQGMEWDMAPFESFWGPTAMYGVRGYRYYRFPFPPSAEEIIITSLVSWVRDLTRDRDESKLVRVPKAFLEDKWLEVMHDLKLRGISESVTTSDVLLAWWAKTSYSLRKHDDKTPVFIHIPVNLRLEPIFPGASILTKQYINNASSTISIPPIAAGVFQTEPLPALALRIRRATTAYHADHLTLEHELRWRNAHPTIELLRCPPGADSALQRNWCDAKLSELNFSGALVGGKKVASVMFVLTDTVMDRSLCRSEETVKF
ncbi:hypothetical protein MSAN_02187300 [Mycena sanguinolenta]|uniref:Uncharacterized protein n=1 Tax=Mycena sanguinolenta TaxID=230812 RepID=A0A8H7CLH5_9AGAR|nr:hypothetical protein MSAN_02187300 [Mycena sanguinolenta]